MKWMLWFCLRLFEDYAHGINANIVDQSKFIFVKTKPPHLCDGGFVDILNN